MATGLLSDWFPEEQRGLVMSIFNWGIYGGFGIAFPVGRYITALNAWDLVSYFRYCFFCITFSRIELRNWYIPEINARSISQNNFRMKEKYNKEREWNSEIASKYYW